MEKYLVPLETPCVYYDADFMSAEEAECAYQDLLLHTKWETSPKINRWVSLCHELVDDDNNNNTAAAAASNNDDDDDDDDDAAANTTTTTIAAADYKYRDAPGASVSGFGPTIQKIKEKAEQWYNNNNNAAAAVHFNVCLLNFYESGQQRIGWHCDREELLGHPNDPHNADTDTTDTDMDGATTTMPRPPPIASVSLGATRQFLLRAKANGVRDRASLHLTAGSLVIMENVCQRRYVHSVPKDANNVGEGRINVTFRCKRDVAKQSAGEEMHERRDHWLDNLVANGAVATGQGWSLSNADNSATACAALKKGANSTTTTDDNGGSNTKVAGSSVTVFGDGVLSGIDVDATTIRFLVQTNLGAEVYCAAEVQEVFVLLRRNSTTVANGSLVDNDDDNNCNSWTVVARPCGMDGYVACCAFDDDDDENDAAAGAAATTTTTTAAVAAALLQLRSAHHVLQYHAHFDLVDCVTEEFPTPELVDGETLYQFVKQRLLAGTMSVSTLQLAARRPCTDATTTTTTTTIPPSLEHHGGSSISFRVTCERIGTKHTFRAPEVEREIGGALSEFYTHCVPSMEDYDVHVRADVVGTLVVIGTQLNVHDLSKERHFLKFRNAVTLKANLAYAMVRCANIQPGARIADPFCGSGTLLLEALDVYDKKLRCLGMDVSKRSVEGSRQNALAEHCGTDVCEFVCSDARGLRRHLSDDSVDAIVTNLPWGVMTGHKNVSDLQTMYEIFLRNSWYVLKDGARIVMFVLRGLQLTRIIRKLSGRYRLLSVNVVRTTNNLPCIIVVEKLAVDEVRESVKGQLAHLNKFVCVSPEMYNAIHMEVIDES